MEKTYIAGVLGAGRIGKIHIENIIYKIPNLKLKVVADINRDDKLEKWANDIGVPRLTKDPNELMLDPEINVVVIASPTNTHIKFIQEAAKAKKDIFCEKPIDTDLKRIKETLEIVKKEGVKLMIGFNRRFDRNFQRVREMVSSGQVGIPHIVKVTARDPAPPSIDYIKTSGGMLFDMTIHDWDMARFQVGSEIEEVYTKGAVLINPEIGKAGDIDTVVLILKFENGAIGMVDNSRQAVYGYDQRVEVFGSKGCAIADNETSNTVRLYTAEKIKEDNIPYFFLQRYMDSYTAELRYFIECLQNNREPSPNGDDGFQNVVIAIAAQKSYEENRPVKISEIVS
ncbi:MAG: inositol 2-dehydrogenase [Candidatus Lokiarchaeota archaeon]|nr:inositol 2-dehydrogenase [Candidatus Lokiarchaeota archaeon]